MKKIIVLVIFFLLMILNIQGNVQSWDSLGITVSKEAMQYVDKFPLVIESEKPLLVEKLEEPQRLRLLFKKIVLIEERFIAYDKDSKLISLIKSNKIREDPFYIILFSFASILLMLISSLLFNKGYNSYYLKSFSLITIFYKLSFVFAILAILAIVASIYFILVTFVNSTEVPIYCVSFFAALFAINKVISIIFSFYDYDHEEKYRTKFVWFFILMAIHIITLFV